MNTTQGRPMLIEVEGKTIKFGLQPERTARYAAASALSKTAAIAKRAVRAEMAQVFDRPTPWILNSLMMRPATAKRLEAFVWFKDEGFKTVAPEKYMRAHVFGGDRPMKRSERSMGGYMIPTDAAPKNQYGNVRGGVYTQMLSNTGNNSDQYSNTPTSRRGLQLRMFAGRPIGGNREPGVYIRQGKSLVPMFFFQKGSPRYRPRLRFFETVEQVTQKNFGRIFADEAQRLRWIQDSPR